MSGFKKEPIRGKYKAGLKVDCWVREKEPGGYSVSVGVHQDAGFIATQNELEIDSWISGLYVCVSNWRILLSDRIEQDDRFECF